MIQMQNKKVDAIVLHGISMTYATEGTWVKGPHLACEKLVLMHESKGEQIGFTYTVDSETFIVLHNGGYTVVTKSIAE